jgi:hypothetical protein
MRDDTAGRICYHHAPEGAQIVRFAVPLAAIRVEVSAVGQFTKTILISIWAAR